MTSSSAGPPPTRRPANLRGVARRSAPLLLLLLLAAAWLVPLGSGEPGLRLATPDRSRVDRFRAAIDGLPSEPLVLVAFDPDLGTYPEIRSATRAMLADLDGHGARTALVSFTPDGRALAAAERDRIAREGGTPPADLGFVAGSEAGLVRGIATIVPESATSVTAEMIRARGGGIAAFDLVVVISGSDLSARSWIEQVGSRLPDLKLASIAPTFLDPELEPYLGSGQLVGLLATLRDGVAYADAVGGSSAASAGATPAALPMLVGMLLALAALLDAAVRRARAPRRASGRSAS